jgi:hypothetical protein
MKHEVLGRFVAILGICIDLLELFVTQERFKLAIIGLIYAILGQTSGTNLMIADVLRFLRAK